MLCSYLLLILVSSCYAARIQLDPTEKIQLFMDDLTVVNYTITDIKDGKPEIIIEDDHIVAVEEIRNDSFVLKGVFLGSTTLTFQYGSESADLHVVVLRKVRAVDKAFTASVAILVSLIYINFGCVLDPTKLWNIVRRPTGPCIGLFGQFIVMPILSYLVGLGLFPNQPDMRLGMLFTGVSPAGGASNIWTCILEGNIDMSVTMTAVSTLAAFALMPAWLFTLGPHIFEQAKITVPYQHVASLAAGLIIPLGIGMALKRWCPKVSAVLARGLKILSSILILFIIIFASITNAHLFSLFTWKILIAGLLLPLAGFLLGWVIASFIARRTYEDTVAIAVETAIQNTGIAIFMLRFALPQPQADLTIVVPVAVSVMTPLPLILLWIYVRFVRRRKMEKKELEINERPATPSAEILKSHVQDNSINP